MKVAIWGLFSFSFLWEGKVGIYCYELKLMYMIQTNRKRDGKIYAETKTNRDIKPYTLEKPNNTRKNIWKYNFISCIPADNSQALLVFSVHSKAIQSGWSVVLIMLIEVSSFLVTKLLHIDQVSQFQMTFRAKHS